MRAQLSELLTALAEVSYQGPAATDILLQGVTTDSRKLQAGSVFVALRGENFDAHDFLADIAASGVAAVIAERVPDNYPLPALLVPDTRQALLQLGRYWRQQFALPVIAVTGSNGKTTVKEMIASILRAEFGEHQVLATKGNLNNEIGVPLTLFELQAYHKAAVIELGMNHPGEIAQLAQAAKANVALVNNAQREHQEFMHSVAAVAEENGAAIQALAADGIAVFPAECEYAGLWHDFSGDRKRLQFGLSEQASMRILSQQVDEASQHLQLQLQADRVDLNLPLLGQHNALNALAAASCCYAIGVSLTSIRAGLESFKAVQGRLQAKLSRKACRLIDDTYNANPDSVRAAIDVLAQAKAGVLVLGDMGEVGDRGAEFHAEVGAYARQRGLTQLFTLGSLSAHAAQAFGDGAQHFSDIADLLAALESQLQVHHTVLVKGSRFMKMERVIAHLVATDQTTQQQGNH